MKLERLYFNYDIPGKNFDHIKWRFDAARGAPPGDAAELAILSLHELEQIADAFYCVQNVSKEEMGDVTSDSTRFGYKYSSPVPYIDAKLFYELDGDGNIDLTLDLFDDDSSRLLGIYDEVMQIPGLELTPKSQTEKEKLDSLRQNGFQIPKYRTPTSTN